jgi:hypothetical protein
MNATCSELTLQYAYHQAYATAPLRCDFGKEIAGTIPARLPWYTRVASCSVLPKAMLNMPVFEAVAGIKIFRLHASRHRLACRTRREGRSESAYVLTIWRNCYESLGCQSHGL